MKYYTPELIEQLGSSDDRTAKEAHEALERQAEAYESSLRAIEGLLPKRLREMQRRFYLHDARVLRASFPGILSGFGLSLATLEFPAVARSPESALDLWPSFAIELQLDAPPRDLLVLHYRDAQVDSASRIMPPDEDCSFLEWLYDEIEPVSTEDGIAFRQSILFTNGFELVLRFRDFDFATLKPIGIHESGFKQRRTKVSA